MNRVVIGLKTVIVILLAMPIVANAQNPVVQTVYTADPAPLVYKDPIFLYTGYAR